MKYFSCVVFALIVFAASPIHAGDPDERIEGIRWKAGESAAVIVINDVPASVIRSGSGWMKLEPYEMPGDNLILVQAIDPTVAGPIEVAVESRRKDGSDAQELAKVTLDENSPPPGKAEINFKTNIETYVYGSLAKIESFSPDDEKAVREHVSRLMQAHRDANAAEILKLYDFSLESEAKISKIDKAKAIESNKRMLDDMFKAFPNLAAKKPGDLRIQKCPKGVIVYSADRVPDNSILIRTDPKEAGKSFPLDQLAFGKIGGKWAIVSFLEF